MSRRKAGNECPFVLPKRPAKLELFEHDRWPGKLVYKRPAKLELTPAESFDITLLAAAGATWADIVHAARLAPEVARGAALMVDAGHGDCFALRYTEFLAMPARERVEWCALFVGRPGRVTEAEDFGRLRARLHVAELESDTLPEMYRLTWPGMRDAHLEALMPLDMMEAVS